MNESVIHLFPSGALLALVGNPNCGKTALFNLLTGSRQKVANYAGVTVERKEGRFTTAKGRKLRLLDLPGVYSLNPRSADERVTVDVLKGRAVGEKRPDLIVCVVDATNLRRNLRLVLAVKRLGLPCVVALNMTDIAEQQGLKVDAKELADALGIPVVKTVAIERDGARQLVEHFDEAGAWHTPRSENQALSSVLGDHAAVSAILERLGLSKQVPNLVSDRIDDWVLHPVFGMVLLAALMFFIFQAVFAWAEAPMGWIESATQWVGDQVQALMPESWFRSLLKDGVIAGIGGVLVFLPQIIILFFFILILEESGYLPRAAFLLDRLMGSVGLSGRSFIPLLSSFACAIPGIMASRTISNSRDRLVTILIAPLMTCSARLPVYALLIAAFIPARKVAGVLEFQGLVLFGLYFAGIASAALVAWVLKRFTAAHQPRALGMELPRYHWPTFRNIALGLWERVKIFLRRVGGVILVLTVLIWFLASYPSPPSGATGPAIEYSFAGMIGRALAVVFAPIGFDWQICTALVPGMAAREVAVSALATVYALSATTQDASGALATVISKTWPLATALSLLAWYVFAPMCLSTLATIRREVGMRYALLAAAYLFALAYLAAFITYRVALLF